MAVLKEIPPPPTLEPEVMELPAPVQADWGVSDDPPVRKVKGHGVGTNPTVIVGCDPNTLSENEAMLLSLL
jgi:hypothetical protein